MPVLGQSVEEVRILAWLKNEGDAVTAGENLAEIETDKVVTFFESPEAGFVRRILVPADSFVRVEAPVVIVADTLEEPIEGDTPPAGVGVALTADVPAASADNLRPAVSPRARRAAAGHDVDFAALIGTGAGGRIQEKDVTGFLATQSAPARTVKASPLARAVAGNAGTDLAGVSGSGAGGRIVADDVRHTSDDARAGAAPPAPVPASVPPALGSHTITLSGIRKRVADNVLKSVQRAPHVTLHTTADMNAVMELRQTLLPTIEKKTGVRLSPTDILLKAVGIALREAPAMNAHIEGDTITRFDAVNIGLAVSLGDDGLIVPVICGADKAGLGEIAVRRDDIAKRARAGTLTGADLSNATFSVSNLGAFGIEAFNPIISPPQVGILGVGTIADAVVARSGVPVVRAVMTLSLSFDHRAMDGAPAAAFLARVREILETPTLLLM